MNRTEPVWQDAALLAVDDEISARFMPLRMPATVVRPIYPHTYKGRQLVYVVYRYPTGEVDGMNLEAHGNIPVNIPRRRGGFVEGERFLYVLSHPSGVVRPGTVGAWNPGPTPASDRWFVELDATAGRPALKTWLPPSLMLPVDATAEQIAAAVTARQAALFPTV